jgi:hypothetical protein
VYLCFSPDPCTKQQLIWDTRIWRRCSWRFRLFGIRRLAAGWAVPDLSKDCGGFSFKTSAALEECLLNSWSRVYHGPSKRRDRSPTTRHLFHKTWILRCYLSQRHLVVSVCNGDSAWFCQRCEVFGSSDLKGFDVRSGTSVSCVTFPGLCLQSNASLPDWGVFVVLFTFSMQMPELFVIRPLPLRSTFINFFYSTNHSPLILSVDST